MNTAPKFPSQTPIRLLLRYHRRTGDAQVLKIATHTLNKMAAGGIYDHVGSGFHRYSTDKHWLVPHFEKMLYDNALLVMAYLEAHQVTGNSAYARIVKETLRYVERDMTSPQGAFYSATDADLLLAAFRKEYLPNRIFSVVAEGKELTSQAEVIPLLQGKSAIKGQPTVFVCEKGVCELPTSDPKVFAKQISVVEKLQGGP